MKTMIKVAIIAVISQAAAVKAEEARPIAVDISVEAGAGALSDKAAEISRALEGGDEAAADRLLSGLYSGGIAKGAAVPVEAAVVQKCCCACSQVAVSTAAAQVPAAVVPAAEKPLDPLEQALKDEEERANAAEAKAKEDKEKAEEAAKRQKDFNWGVTIMTVALLLLFVLL